MYDELSKQPYAGILFLTLIERFDELTEQEQQVWEVCIENLYVLELEVLSKASASRIGKFLKTMVFNMKNGEVKRRAIMALDKLSHIHMFKDVIEEQNETALHLGEEEVRILKKDAVESPFPYFIDLIKFSITGNIK